MVKLNPSELFGLQEIPHSLNSNVAIRMVLLGGGKKNAMFYLVYIVLRKYHSEFGNANVLFL